MATSTINLIEEAIMKLIDRIGLRYGRLVVTERAPNKSANDTNARWVCKCDCGNETINYGQDLGRENVKSCGCAAKNRIAEIGKGNRTHGMSRTVVYRTWASMLKRCNNPRDLRYSNYGARGIKVCERWLKFENFFSDMGFPSEKMSLDRINNNGDYEFSNCRWATKGEQACNRRGCIKLTHKGLTLTVAEWSRVLKISVSTMRDRITAGFTDDKLFSPNLKERNQS